MARQVAENTGTKILTVEQEQFLEVVSNEKTLRELFYFTGGTPLSAFYLHHRLSEDIDLFSEEEIKIATIQSFIKKVQKLLHIVKVEYNTFLGLHSFQLYFSDTNILKVDFNYYPFPRIEKGTTYKNIAVDSILDIAVNKMQTIATKPRARDFIDLFFIIQKKGYILGELLKTARNKFDWHTDPLQFGSRLLQATEVKDFPRMIKQINHQEWQDFFVEEAKKMKPEIIA